MLGGNGLGLVLVLGNVLGGVLVAVGALADCVASEGRTLATTGA